jgi:hypothetical protein
VPDDRDNLIRRHFEVMRELTWMEELEPRCRAEGMDSERIRDLRKAWNAFSEARDWEWWQKDSARQSSESLQAAIKEGIERMSALPEYRQALAEASRRPGNDKDKGIDR